MGIERLTRNAKLFAGGLFLTYILWTAADFTYTRRFGPSTASGKRIELREYRNSSNLYQVMRLGKALSLKHSP